MNKEIQRAIILASLGGSAYMVLVCPCEQMGYCKRDLFLGLSLVPLGFALYNYTITAETCTI